MGLVSRQLRLSVSLEEVWGNGDRLGFAGAEVTSNSSWKDCVPRHSQISLPICKVQM